MISAFPRLGGVQGFDGPAGPAGAPPAGPAGAGPAGAPPAGFLLTLSPHTSCLSSRRRQLVLVPCDLADPAQRWAWLAGARLVHAQSSRCLWADTSHAHLPGHAHPAKLSGCREAPAWGCFNGGRGFGLAQTHLYLRHQEAGLVVGGDTPPPEWRRYDVDAGGNERTRSLCTDAGERRQVMVEGVQVYQPLQVQVSPHQHVYYKQII